MIENEFTVERFLKDVKKHELKILSDDGIYRTLRLMAPKDSNCYYMLTTWPGHLCISGDMGTYVFERTEDMFRFFRRDELTVNHTYWYEKLQADSKFGGALKFSYELFKETVLEMMQERASDCEWSEETVADCRNDLELYVFDEDYNHVEGVCQMKAYEFSYEDSKGDTWDLSDHWEHPCKQYTFHFTWILHAIVWGIQQYDAYQEKQNEAMEQLKRMVARVNADLEKANNTYDLFNSGSF